MLPSSPLMKVTYISQLALLAVIVLISFLAYGSQILFRYLEPHHLEHAQTVRFNVLVACIWICYLRACFTNPGIVPLSWGTNSLDMNEIHVPKQRWCRKCETFKPPRAHHCKICMRCIPKMDHHCPWTINCVSYRTFPHFFRFLLYAVVSMIYLEYFLFLRATLVWNARALPSYLGPSSSQLIFLFIFIISNSVTLFALSVMLISNAWSLVSNTTTIESWEVERHEKLVHRARKQGGYVGGPDGIKLRITKQEFPYDIGVYKNIRQSMGRWPIFWLLPFAPTPRNADGLGFDTNGFEGSSVSWPPPDPDRIPRRQIQRDTTEAFLYEDLSTSSQHDINAFRQRQARFASGYRDNAFNPLQQNQYHADLSWRNSEGERLQDFGVDEDVDHFDEDDIPLASLIRRSPQ